MLPHGSGEAGERSETEGADSVAIGDWGIFENYSCESERFLFKYLSRKIKLHFRFIEIIVLLTIKV